MAMTIQALYETHIRALTPAEQLKIMELIAHELSIAASDTVLTSAGKWSDIRGAANYPMTGEDAQDWVTRSRQEADR